MTFADMILLQIVEVGVEVFFKETNGPRILAHWSALETKICHSVEIRLWQSVVTQTIFHSTTMLVFLQTFSVSISKFIPSGFFLFHTTIWSFLIHFHQNWGISSFSDPTI
ncbi:MAG: hypothetical protein ACD_71C00168G0001 [uncultured bacterium (gcode 4)]|uniref:Uncharacterized protein n=1 Tax=uncultured bacterium (gcode 4) TaxID=1234023 RepID=K1Z4Z6_9BACT|nr:MAG: hypothetical protein ACD_71C00168G0001 [uncultured bacterium (gcode 4)]